VLVEHRVDDVGERLVRVEEAVTAGEQVPLEPAEQRVLGQHLHDSTVATELPAVGVLRQQVRHPDFLACLVDGLEAVGGSLVRTETRKLAGFCRITSRRNSPRGFVFSCNVAPRVATGTA